jgi:hypothetical protein
MEKQSPQQPTSKPLKRENEEAKKRLERPAKDKREVTIGPTTSTGPDITTG